MIAIVKLLEGSGWAVGVPKQFSHRRATLLFSLQRWTKSILLFPAGSWSPDVVGGVDGSNCYGALGHRLGHYSIPPPRAEGVDPQPVKRFRHTRGCVGPELHLTAALMPPHPLRVSCIYGWTSTHAHAAHQRRSWPLAACHKLVACGFAALPSCLHVTSHPDRFPWATCVTYPLPFCSMHFWFL